MKKFSKMALSISTLALLLGVTVPAQAAIYAANNYSSSGGYRIPLSNYFYSAPAQAPTSTPSTTPTTTPTTPVYSPVTTPTGTGSSVVSLKNYMYNYSAPSTPTPAPTPAPAPAPAPTPTPTPTPTPAPTPVPAPTPSTGTIPAASSVSAQEQQMIDEINKERANAGLAPLKVDLRLVGVAQAKANDMKTNGYFSHTSPTYGSPYDMMKMAGIRYYSAGENIARNISVDAAMAAFMSSSGHKANILNANYTHVGVGIVYSSAGSYFVQEFARE